MRQAVEFLPVAERERAVAIVAGGPSLRGFDFTHLDGLTVITVNAVVRYVRADYWITIDPDYHQLVLMRNRVDGVRYYCGVPTHYGPRSPYPPFRTPLLGHVHYLRRVTETGLSEDPSIIHSGNSAFAALGLAYHMGAKSVALLGVDGTTDPYFYAGERGSAHAHRPTPRVLDMPRLFASALTQLELRGITVVNGSPKSRVACFPRTTPERAVRWLHEHASAEAVS